jgi:murein DD-endopeptidase MepM/ murein hydrolase activator NlpD
MISNVNLTPVITLSPGDRLEPRDIVARIQSVFAEIMVEAMEGKVEDPQGYLRAASAAPEELPVAGQITSLRGWRLDPVNGELRFHAGVDIAAMAGSPVRAVADGRVVESGAKGGYGNSVVVETDDGRTMLYAHNHRNLVQAGDRVTRGDAIALVGATGRATGPHVHFEVE